MKRCLMVLEIIGVCCVAVMQAYGVMTEDNCAYENPACPAKDVVYMVGDDATIDEVRALPADRWRTLAANEDNLGFCKHAMWVRMKFSNDTPHAVQRVLELPFARLADQRVMLRDLHDGLGGIAAAVSLMAAYGKRSADPAIKNGRFEAIERMTGYASAEIRSLLNTLEKPVPYWADWLCGRCA